MSRAVTSACTFTQGLAADRAMVANRLRRQGRTSTPQNRGIHAGLNGPGHAGDLGNITVAADGKGKLDVVQKDLTIEPGKMNILGKPIVLHAHSDNLTDKPENGGSDGRLACGVLGST